MRKIYAIILLIILVFGILLYVAKANTPDVPGVSFNTELIQTDGYTYRVFTNQNGIYVINLDKQRLEIEKLKRDK